MSDIRPYSVAWYQMQQRQSTTCSKNPTESGFPDSSGGTAGSGIVDLDLAKFQEAGTIIFYQGALYRANDDNPANTPFAEGTSGATFTRVQVFDAIQTDKAYIPGDMILASDDASYYVKTGFTISSAGGESLANHLDSIVVISDDRESRIETYVDGKSIKENSLFLYNDNIYYASTAIDGTLDENSTWEKIETKVSLVSGIETIYPRFDMALVYNEGDKVFYKDFLWTRNTYGRFGNDPFNVSQFDRDIPAGFDYGDFRPGSPYLKGDRVKVDGIVYEGQRYPWRLL